MESVLTAFTLTLLAGLATCIGSVFVLFIKQANLRFLAGALAFSAGAMIYVSFVEILAKAKDALTPIYGDFYGQVSTIGFFFVGALIFVAIDRLIPAPINPHHMENHMTPDGNLIADTFNKSKLIRMGAVTMLALSAHNVPEGMATFFSSLESATLGLTIAVAIGIHNIPEGISVAVPVFYATGSRIQAFMYALVSGLAEPVGAIAGYFVLKPLLDSAALGIIFAILAGIMVFLSLDELLPMAKRYSKGHETLYGMGLGMGVMAASLLLFQI